MCRARSRPASASGRGHHASVQLGVAALACPSAHTRTVVAAPWHATHARTRRTGGPGCSATTAVASAWLLCHRRRVRLAALPPRACLVVPCTRGHIWHCLHVALPHLPCHHIGARRCYVAASSYQRHPLWRVGWSHCHRLVVYGRAAHRPEHVGHFSIALYPYAIVH